MPYPDALDISWLISLSIKQTVGSAISAQQFRILCRQLTNFTRSSIDNVTCDTRVKFTFDLIPCTKNKTLDRVNSSHTYLPSHVCSEFSASGGLSLTMTVHAHTSKEGVLTGQERTNWRSLTVLTFL